MADVELLPLPTRLAASGLKSEIVNFAERMAEHNVKERDAEIEALRAEVAAWRELSDHVRAGACNAIWPDRYTDARTRDVAASLKRAKPLKAEIEALLAEAIEWRGLFGMAKARADKAEARAERMAEALLELCNVIDGHEVPVAVEAKAAHARDALHDHDKGESNAP